MSAAKFFSAFMASSPANRFQLIMRTTQANSADSRIGNLLSNLNVNDTDPKNRTKADSIHFVCQQLQAFPGFVCPN